MKNVKKCKKKCKKMQNYLHMSKKSCTFAEDLGIVPSATIKYNRVMKRKNALSALGEKKRNLVLSLGRKKIMVYEVVSGKGAGLGIVQCSMYPDLTGVFADLETAVARAYKIKRFHERQLEIMFAE